MESGNGYHYFENEEEEKREVLNYLFVDFKKNEGKNCSKREEKMFFEKLSCLNLSELIILKSQC